MVAGRPSVMTTEILEQLRTAFAMGCTDQEACAFAKIGISTLYDYQRAHPEFSYEKEQLKETPILKAKATILKTLNDPKNAQWYLERKKKDEFSTRSEVTGKDGKDLPTPLLFNLKKDGLERSEEVPQTTGEERV